MTISKQEKLKILNTVCARIPLDPQHDIRYMSLSENYQQILFANVIYLHSYKAIFILFYEHQINQPSVFKLSHSLGLSL